MSRTQPWWNPFQPTAEDPLLEVAREERRERAVTHVDRLSFELAALSNEKAAAEEAPTRHEFETFRAQYRQLEILVDLVSQKVQQLDQKTQQLDDWLKMLAWSVQRDFKFTPAKEIPSRVIPEKWEVVETDD